jgi:hypothetical protein
MWSRKKRNCLSPKVWTIKREIYRAFALRNLEHVLFQMSKTTLKNKNLQKQKKGHAALCYFVLKILPISFVAPVLEKLCRLNGLRIIKIFTDFLLIPHSANISTIPVHSGADAAWNRIIFVESDP